VHYRFLLAVIPPHLPVVELSPLLIGFVQGVIWTRWHHSFSFPPSFRRVFPRFFSFSTSDTFSECSKRSFKNHSCPSPFPLSVLLDQMSAIPRDRLFFLYWNPDRRILRGSGVFCFFFPVFSCTHWPLCPAFQALTLMPPPRLNFQFLRWGRAFYSRRSPKFKRDYPL